MAKTVVNKSTDYTILPEECNGTYLFTNQGATGVIMFTLPTITGTMEVNISNKTNNLPIKVYSHGNLNWGGSNIGLDPTNGTEINLISSGAAWNGTSIQVAHSVSAPTAQSYNLTLSGTAQTTMNATWTNGNGTKTLILMNPGTTISDTPVNDVTYTANLAYGSGSLIGSSYVIYAGSGTSLTVTGLTSNTRYVMRLYSYNTDPIFGPQYNLSTAETYVIRSRFTLL